MFLRFHQDEHGSSDLYQNCRVCLMSSDGTRFCTRAVTSPFSDVIRWNMILYLNCRVSLMWNMVVLYLYVRTAVFLRCHQVKQSSVVFVGVVCLYQLELLRFSDGISWNSVVLQFNLHQELSRFYDAIRRNIAVLYFNLHQKGHLSAMSSGRT